MKQGGVDGEKSDQEVREAATRRHGSQGGAAQEAGGGTADETGGGAKTVGGQAT
jgi:hypothetical protein